MWVKVCRYSCNSFINLFSIASITEISLSVATVTVSFVLKLTFIAQWWHIEALHWLYLFILALFLALTVLCWSGIKQLLLWEALWCSFCRPVTPPSSVAVTCFSCDFVTFKAGWPTSFCLDEAPSWLFLAKGLKALFYERELDLSDCLSSSSSGLAALTNS